MTSMYLYRKRENKYGKIVTIVETKSRDKITLKMKKKKKKTLHGLRKIYGRNYLYTYICIYNHLKFVFKSNSLKL